MQIRKVYIDVKPDLLYDEVRDFVLKQGAILGETKLETYSLPSDSSSFISRGTLIFKAQGGTGKEQCQSRPLSHAISNKSLEYWDLCKSGKIHKSTGHRSE